LARRWSAQGWYWTQSIKTRRPRYMPNRYVCWSSAWFQPSSEDTGSETLVLNSGLFTQSYYYRMFSFYPGLTVLIVAKWDGQHGAANHQDMLTRGIDTYMSGYTTMYGWGMTVSEKGVAGAKFYAYVNYDYCYYYYYCCA
jgi:hypothetical protein